MTAKTEMTPDLMDAFKRLMRYVPEEIRQDQQTRETAMAYLKLGGERLARYYLQMIQKEFPVKPTFIKKRLHLDADDDLEDTTQDDEDEDDEDEDDDPEAEDGAESRSGRAD